MKTIEIAVAVFASALVLAAHAQTVYRWTDKDGKVHFSDTPPPEDAKSASQKRVGGGGYVEDTQLPYATQIAVRRNPVTLYTGTDCGDPCMKGRELLAKRGIPFSEKDAQNNQADQEALKKLTGTLDVPVLVIGENKTKGYEESLWQSALDTAGYPRTRLPGQGPLRVPSAPVAPPKAAEPASTEPNTEPPAESK
jgi:glutaredoxin